MAGTWKTSQPQDDASRKVVGEFIKSPIGSLEDNERLDRTSLSPYDNFHGGRAQVQQRFQLLPDGQRRGIVFSKPIAQSQGAASVCRVPTQNSICSNFPFRVLAGSPISGAVSRNKSPSSRNGCVVGTGKRRLPGKTLN